MPLTSLPARIIKKRKLANIWVVALVLMPPAQHGRGAKMTEYFTGRSITLEAAVGMADQIIVGRLVETGQADVGAPGQTYYDHASAEVVRWLAGAPPLSKRPQSVTFAYTVQGLPQEKRESAPAVGQTYIFFFKDEQGTSRAIKILPGDQPNITKVEKLVPPQQ